MCACGLTTGGASGWGLAEGQTSTRGNGSLNGLPCVPLRLFRLARSARHGYPPPVALPAPCRQVVARAAAGVAHQHPKRHAGRRSLRGAAGLDWGLRLAAQAEERRNTSKALQPVDTVSHHARLPRS
jgi:hypothetical protein